MHEVPDILGLYFLGSKADLLVKDQEIRALREQTQIMSKQLADVIEQQQQHANTFDMKFVKLLDIVKTGC